MIYPESCVVEEPNEDMPEEVKDRYLEAAKVFSGSSCAAAAILRLALQLLLMDILGESSSGNVKNDINELKSRQLDSRLIMALDTVRLNGNEAVHPGTIDLSENREDAEFLFILMNMIAEQLYTYPKKMKAAYEKLPESKRILKGE